MRVGSIKYPLLTAYEILRSVLLLKTGALTGVATLPITWYAGLPLLCITPLAFLILASDEDRYASSWLPPIALLKALGILSLLAFASFNLSDAIRFGAGGDLSPFAAIVAAVVFALCDAAVGVYCLRRNAKLCK
jgi:hypothetical protein